MNVARCCCVAPNVNNLTHLPPASSHSLPFPPPTLWHAMWGNICLRGTLTIFGYLHLICIARNAMRHANYNAYAPGQTRESTPAPPLRLPVVFQMTAALRRCARPINFRHVTANYTFSIFAPHACYLSFFFSLSFSFFPLSISLSLQCRKLQINQAKRRPSKCTRPARTMTPSPARHCPACRRRASPTPMRAVNRNIL